MFSHHLYPTYFLLLLFKFFLLLFYCTTFFFKTSVFPRQKYKALNLYSPHLTFLFFKYFTYEPLCQRLLHSKVMQVNSEGL